MSDPSTGVGGGHGRESWLGLTLRNRKCIRRLLYQGHAINPEGAAQRDVLYAIGIAALLEHNLLESFVIDIQFKDGAQHRFSGFYTIQEERLAKLDGAALGKLHERGYLQPIYMVIASFSNFRGLIERASRLNAADR